MVGRADDSSVPRARRVAIYDANANAALARNQMAAMKRYAEAMGWLPVAVIGGDAHSLLAGAATHAFDLVLCWRTSDLPHAHALFARLAAHGVDLLAVAQSCAALSE